MFTLRFHSNFTISSTSHPLFIQSLSLYLCFEFIISYLHLQFANTKIIGKKTTKMHKSTPKSNSLCQQWMSVNLKINALPCSSLFTSLHFSPMTMTMNLTINLFALLCVITIITVVIIANFKNINSAPKSAEKCTKFAHYFGWTTNWKQE